MQGVKKAYIPSSSDATKQSKMLKGQKVLGSFLLDFIRVYWKHNRINRPKSLPAIYPPYKLVMIEKLRPFSASLYEGVPQAADLVTVN